MITNFFPDDWSDTTYAVDALVNYSGAIYKARNVISSATGKTPFNDPDNWKVQYINRIENVYSLIEAIKLQIRNTNDSIVGSIPMFIQLAEQSFTMKVRVPAQIDTDILTVDSKNRVEIPQALLNVKNVELISEGTSDSLYDNQLLNNARYELIELNRYEYQKIKIQYAGDTTYIDREPLGYRSAGYWNDGRYLHFAPSLGSGTKIRVVGQYQLTPLCYPINLTNSDGDAINSEGQTEAQWVADGNAEADFVQATGIQETNYFLQAAPRIFLYGAIMQAEQFLKDDDRWPLWEQQFEKAQMELEELTDMFNEDRPSATVFESDYPLG